MPHSLSKIWMHVVFATKNHKKIINEEIRELVHTQIAGSLDKSGCPVSIINGTANHVHVLFLMNPKKAISDVMKYTKRVSSQWINSQKLLPEKFSWEVGYSAFSVSESKVGAVINYIRNQGAHHEKQTYREEVDVFIKNYGLA